MRRISKAWYVIMNVSVKMNNWGSQKESAQGLTQCPFCMNSCFGSFHFHRQLQYSGSSCGLKPESRVFFDWQILSDMWVYYLSCISTIFGPFCLSSTWLNNFLKNHRPAWCLGLYRHSVNLEWMVSCSLQTLFFFIFPSAVKPSNPEMRLNPLSCTYHQPLCGPSAQLTNYHPFLLYPSIILILYLPLLILFPVLRIPFPSLPDPAGKFLVIF